KGEDVDKEIYVLDRLQADESEKKEARLALHFDQTVPLARYVGQHFNELDFPFKRYQMQKVWRGERPQTGRFREFTQCDIDVINVDNLPLSFDAEMPRIIHEVLSGLDIPKFQIRISNRKILSGLVSAYGAKTHEQQASIFRVIDKKEKLDKDNFEEQLANALAPYNYNDINALSDVKAVLAYQDLLADMDSSQQIDFLRELITALNQTTWIEFEKKYDLTKIHYFYHDFGQGFVDLYDVMNWLSDLQKNSVRVDLSIVRGLDYYTGTVYETIFVDDPSYGSICSGGRYDDLASSYINKKLPGVGISIGFSRLFAKMEKELKAQGKAKRISPADVLVILNSEDDRADVTTIANTLRNNGNNVELYHAPQKFSKQMSYAEKKGIPFVWMPPFGDTTVHEVKDMASGEQVQADYTTWKANNA
ncbi:MAG: histidine--tRNA ligase, partial [Bdellovibrionales bacterium]